MKCKKLLLFVFFIFCSMLIYPTFVSASNVRATPRLSTGYKWSAVPRTINFNYDGTDYTRNGSTDDEIAAISAAMNTWNSVKHASTNSNLVTMKCTSVASVNTIEFAEAQFNYAGNTEPTLSDVDSSIIVSAKVLINIDRYWATDGSSPLSYDLQTILTHELGHVLGVAHCHEENPYYSTECVNPSTCSSNIMKPLISLNEVMHTLSAYDKASYQLIYY